MGTPSECQEQKPKFELSEKKIRYIACDIFDIFLLVKHNHLMMNLLATRSNYISNSEPRQVSCHVLLLSNRSLCKISEAHCYKSSFTSNTYNKINISKNSYNVLWFCIWSIRNLIFWSNNFWIPALLILAQSGLS